MRCTPSCLASCSAPYCMERKKGSEARLGTKPMVGAVCACRTRPPASKPMAASAQQAARRNDDRDPLDIFVSFLDWIDGYLDVTEADHYTTMKALSAVLSSTYVKLHRNLPCYARKIWDSKRRPPPYEA